MSPTTRFYRYLALGSYIGLLAWVAVWQLLLNTDHSYSLTFIAIIYLLPLLLPAKGMIQGKPYTHAWANFVVLFYLIHGCTVMYAIEAERLYAAIELILVMLMFTGCCVFARRRGKELGLGLTKLKDEMKREREYFEGKN
ncbi:DUF2069 domain-containing protein [Alteromonas pelagimontana]|uniref:DUF2069 domain-containing protein n=2 Tax=Alteromonas pelagimontana TaxID=1858656 RepID=A0A6M4MI33_9ALTE|nr:DUF2069 domain-containing protein [Alteromonas pelagimontana]QJR82682.1 DUF2069 domain-containing protein [Alteromonas pelagimontana]